MRSTDGYPRHGQLSVIADVGTQRGVSLGGGGAVCGAFVFDAEEGEDFFLGGFAFFLEEFGFGGLAGFAEAFEGADLGADELEGFNDFSEEFLGGVAEAGAVFEEFVDGLAEGFDAASLAITAAEALSLHAAMQAAEALIDTRKQAQSAAKLVGGGDVDGLYDEVSGTIAELRGLLSVTDPRWELFGLNIPANPTVPEGVGSLTVTAAGVGRLLAAWTYAVRAEYYRVFLKRVGVDDEAVNVADPRDLEYTLKDLTPGTTVEVFVVPMNGAGAGGASPTVSVGVP